MGVVLSYGSDLDMKKQQEARLLAEFRRMSEQEKVFALAMFQKINKDKPDLPVLKLVVGGRR